MVVPMLYACASLSFSLSLSHTHIHTHIPPKHPSHTHTLPQTVQAVLQGYVERVDEAFSTAVDTQRLTTTSGHSAARVQDALWSGLSRAFSQLQSAVVQVCLLQRVLGKKKDPLTHVLFLDEVTKHGQQPPLTALWYEGGVHLKWIVVVVVVGCGAMWCG